MISIIVPIYNTSKYLRECIESILSKVIVFINFLFIKTYKRICKYI